MRCAPTSFAPAATRSFSIARSRSFDGRTRAEGFHILHDWDGVAQQTNPDIIPIDVLHFSPTSAAPRPASHVELAILLDYYFMHVLALLTMRIWDDGDPDENLARLNALLAELQGPNGSGQQFAADAETLMLIGTSHFEPEEWGYGKLLVEVRTLNEHHQFKIGLGHAASMGCHLRFGFEAQCGRDTLALRDDNIADYPWLCFALAAVMREYCAPRRRRHRRTLRDRAVIEEALLNGLTPDARAFVGVPPPSLSRSEADRAALRRRLHAPQGRAARGVSNATARPTPPTRRSRSSSTSRTTSSKARSWTRCCGGRRGTCR